MSTLQNKIDFVALISVNMANANGDPLNGNRPRTDYNNYGEISDVCIKRKIRNRMQDQGYPIFVQSDLYLLKGSINVQLAEKTGFTEEDAQVVKECLRTLFVNDASAARPDGSMEVVKLFWWQHNCKDGQYSSAKVHRSVKVTLKDSDQIPSSVDDYAITVEALPGLEPEVIDGL